MVGNDKSGIVEEQIMYTIGRLAKKCGLSRSALLYYDRIDLLKPSGRKPNGYRYYTEEDLCRLGKIRTYRRAGLKIPDISRILDSKNGRIAQILENRLQELNEEIEALREQQRFVISLLREPETLAACSGPMDKQKWTRLLRSAGFTDGDMLRWHIEFERHWPEEHQKFLAILGIPPNEIEALRLLSRLGDNDQHFANNLSDSVFDDVNR